MGGGCSPQAQEAPGCASESRRPRPLAPPGDPGRLGRPCPARAPRSRPLDRPCGAPRPGWAPTEPAEPGGTGGGSGQGVPRTAAGRALGLPGPRGSGSWGSAGQGDWPRSPLANPAGRGGRVRGGGVGGAREALPGICRGAAPTAGREGGGERAAGEPGEGPQDGARPPPAPCPGKTPLGCPWAPPLLRQRSAGGAPLTRSCTGQDEPAGGGGRSGDRRARARRGAGCQGPASSRLSPRPPGETWGPPKASWVASCWETWLPALPVHGGPGSRVAFPRAGPRRPEVKRARRRCVPQAHARRGSPGPSAPERVKPTAGRDLPSRTPSRPRGRLSQLPARSCPLQAAPPPRRRAPARAPRPAESR